MDDLDFETRDYPDMAAAAKFALSWGHGGVETVMAAVSRGRFPVRCECDYEQCPGWVMLPVGAFADMLHALHPCVECGHPEDDHYDGVGSCLGDFPKVDMCVKYVPRQDAS